MAKRKDKDKKKAFKDQKWEKESKQIRDFRAKAPQLKALARSRGCKLRFYDFLDSNEEEFNTIALEAKSRFLSLVGVFELNNEEYEREEFSKYGIAAEWQKVKFRTGEAIADTYNDPDPKANLNGKTIAFLAPGDQLKTLVFVPRQVECPFAHREYKYHFKLIALCHELGHVEDLEKRINLDPVAKTVRLVDAEVYAHLFAVNEANRRHLFSVANTLEDSLRNYAAATDYRGEVARQFLAKYQRPEQKGWQDYTASE